MRVVSTNKSGTGRASPSLKTAMKLANNSDG
jgi:hypothetical protein